MKITRRWFLRATATTAIGLVAARAVPVSWLPTEGPLHKEIHGHVIKWLLARYRSYVNTAGRPPRRIFVGPALYDNYESELDAASRICVCDDGYRALQLMFKGVPLEVRESLGPWEIGMVS